MWWAQCSSSICLIYSLIYWDTTKHLQSKKRMKPSHWLNWINSQPLYIFHINDLNMRQCDRKKTTRFFSQQKIQTLTVHFTQPHSSLSVLNVMHLRCILIVLYSHDDKIIPTRIRVCWRTVFIRLVFLVLKWRGDERVLGKTWQFFVSFRQTHLHCITFKCELWMHFIMNSFFFLSFCPFCLQFAYVSVGVCLPTTECFRFVCKCAAFLFV